jgi:hypothetical protein
MALIPTVKINGKIVDPPVNWLDIEIQIAFNASGSPAVITTDEWIFANDTNDYILELIKNNLLQALIVEVNISDGADSYDFPKHIIDTRTITIIHSTKLSCIVKQIRGLDLFEERLRSITYDLLAEEGFITEDDYVDIDYVIEEVFDGAKTAILLALIYLTTSQLFNLIQATAIQVAQLASLIVTGIGGSLGAAILSAVTLVANTISGVAISIALINLIEQVAPQVLPPAKVFKGIGLQTMLSSACLKLGYEFNTSIEEIKDTYYLPTKNKRYAIGNSLRPYNNDNGLPNTDDYGFITIEAFELAKIQYEGDFYINEVDKTIQFEPLINDTFWRQTAPIALEDILTEDPQKATNAIDFKGYRTIQYLIDPKDDYTLINLKGTFYDINTVKTNSVDPDLDLTTGLRQDVMNVSLGNIKDEFTGLEGTFSSFIDNANRLLGAFGIGRINNPVSNKLGMVKVSEQFYSEPKLLYMKKVNGRLRIPSNHRDVLSAKAIYHKYLKNSSYSLEDYRNQYSQYRSERFPINVKSLLLLLGNGSATFRGKEAFISSAKFTLGGGATLIDFDQRETYDTQIKEIYTEPE